MVDSSDASRDSNITTYLLNRAIAGEGFQCSDNNASEQVEQPWSMDKLRAYISIVKDRFNPTISSDAALLMERHYEKCRSAESTTIPITVRFLESMIRLSQAHARLLYRSIVTLQDAVAILRIMECSAFAYGGFDSNVDDVHNVMYCDPMTIDFSNNADLDFLAFQLKILERYGLVNRMQPDDQKKALEYINEGSISQRWEDDQCSEMTHHTSAWQTLQTGTVQEDHYGRFHFPTQSPFQKRHQQGT